LAGAAAVAAAASSAAFWSAAALSAAAFSASEDVMTMMKRTWTMQTVGGEQSRT
jgi:hypothetical protein